MRKLLTVIFVAATLSAGAQANRWFGIEQADSTQWGWNLPRYMYDYYYLPDKPEGATFEFTYVATDTVSTEDDGYYVTFGGFYILRNEVTQQQWIDVMGSANPCWTQRGDDLPATIASPDEALAFCHKLDSILSFGFRIPTLGEWIFAAKGGHFSEGYNYAGSNNPNHVAWHKGNSNGRLHPVTQKIPNELNIFDMSGNACELVESGSMTSLVGDTTWIPTYAFMGGSCSQEPIPFTIPSAQKLKPSIFPGFRIVYSREQPFYDSSK